jgi:hypothetical protein
MAPIERIVRFMETLDSQFLNDAFALAEVVLIENFAPYVFEGSDAVARWAKGFAEHAKNIKELRHSFGDPQDFHLDGELAFLSLPTIWRGIIGASSFIETGGWAFVLVKHASGWRVRNYGWAVTGIATKARVN